MDIGSIVCVKVQYRHTFEIWMPKYSLVHLWLVKAVFKKKRMFSEHGRYTFGVSPENRTHENVEARHLAQAHILQ